MSVSLVKETFVFIDLVHWEREITAEMAAIRYGKHSISAACAREYEFDRIMTADEWHTYCERYGVLSARIEADADKLARGHANCWQPTVGMHARPAWSGVIELDEL